jgi:putative peptidoglycan lipid II flippase
MVKNILKQGHQIFERQQNNILSAAGIITGSVFLSAILGLVRNRLLVSFFFYNPSTKAALDAWFLAFRLPDFVFQLLVVGALSAAFIPVFAKYQAKNPKEANETASSMMNLVLIGFVIISIPIFLFTEQITKLTTGSNFQPSQLSLAVSFTRIMLLAQFFFAISNFLTGIIQAHQRFLIPALSPVVYNLGIIIGIIVLGPKLGLYGPTLGVVLGAFFHLALQIPLSYKLGFVYSPSINFRLPGVKEICKLMPPRTLGLSVNQLELSMMAYLATSLPQGSLTIVNLAQQLMGLPVRVFGMPIGQASFPFLSKENALEDQDKFKQIFLNSLNQILYLALPATAMIIVLRIPFVRIAYGSKSFPWLATLLTGRMVAIMSLSICADAASHLFTRAFYALHNTKTPMISAIMSLAANTIISIFFIYTLHSGILGLAYGLAISNFIQSIFLLFRIKHHLTNLSYQELLVTPIKIIIASALTGIFLWFFMHFFDQFVFDTTRTLSLIGLTILVGAIGTTIYMIISKIMAIEEMNSYLNLISKLGNWRKVLSSSSETIEQTSETI